MKVSSDRRQTREDKLEKDYIKMRKEVIDPVIKDFIKQVSKSDFDVKLEREELLSIITLECTKPYMEINIEIGMNEDMDAITLWVDVADEYGQWTEVAETKISKVVSKDQLLKDMTEALKKSQVAFPLKAISGKEKVNAFPVVCN